MLVSIAAHLTGWSLGELYHLPLALLFSLSHAASCVEGVPMRWAVAVEGQVNEYKNAINQLRCKR